MNPHWCWHLLSQPNHNLNPIQLGVGGRNHLRPPSALRRLSYTNRNGPEMVSKFKLDHFVHVKKKIGPEIFLGPHLGAPQSLSIIKWDILENWNFNFEYILVILLGWNWVKKLGLEFVGFVLSYLRTKCSASHEIQLGLPIKFEDVLSGDPFPSSNYREKFLLLHAMSTPLVHYVSDLLMINPVHWTVQCVMS